MTFGGKADDICHSLSTVHSSFGRMEKFDLPRHTILERADKVSGKAAEVGTVSKADMEAVPGGRSEAAPEEKNKTENAETEKTVPVRMILVKNPAGCSQTIDYLSRIDEDFLLVICLNDRTADGHDISWIWDADYERLSENTHIQSMIVSGDRAEDLRVRLKYAGIDEKKIAMEKDNESLLSSMRSSTLPVFVMPNYTSMLALRKILSDATGKREFWEKQS